MQFGGLPIDTSQSGLLKQLGSMCLKEIIIGDVILCSSAHCCIVYKEVFKQTL